MFWFFVSNSPISSIIRFTVGLWLVSTWSVVSCINSRNWSTSSSGTSGSALAASYSALSAWLRFWRPRLEQLPGLQYRDTLTRLLRRDEGLFDAGSI